MTEGGKAVVEQAPGDVEQRIVDDDRFAVPLYTVAEAARHLGVPASTLGAWTRGYARRFSDRPAVVGRPVLTALPSNGAGGPSVPFIGLAEGMVLAAIRRRGVPLQRIRPALQTLVETLGLRHALASQALYTDGAEVLYDFAEKAADTPAAHGARELVVLRNGQRVFADVIEDYLHRIEYGPDGYAHLIRLPQYRRAEVIADPRHAFGQPFFARGGARVDDVLQRFWTGEDLELVSREFGVPLPDLEDAVRVASRRAA